MQATNSAHKKPPARVTGAPDTKLLVSREEAAQPPRRIGGRVLIPVADLRKYARGDHPERIVV
jgi:hypothetical protein